MAKIKIAIIGAGPSGFAVAEVLRRKEYADIFDFTIYEKNDYVGGKCCTIFANGEVCNGRPDGYEVGAVVVAKQSDGYAELVKLINKYSLVTTVHHAPRGHGLEYIQGGKMIDVSQYGQRTLFFKPRQLFKAFRGFEDYLLDYARYAHSKHTGYAHRPKRLSRRLSRLYSRQVNSLLSGIMQGFGYADLDDQYLTPPLLYYHQYLDMGVLESPLRSFATGTQGIWAKIASTYPQHTIRLNEQVLHVERSAQSVTVVTPQGQETFDYLVVATPLKPALKFLDSDQSTKQFLGKMKHNHYVTVFCSVSNFEHQYIGNIDNCTNKKYLGHILCGYKRYNDSDLVALYLYIKPGARTDDHAILDAVESSLEQDFSARLIGREQAKIFHWDDYFGHLDSKDIRNGWYEKFDDEIQGQNRTLYVSSGLHMETMGASVQFGTALAEKYAELWMRDNTS